jgi:hypothetical protein
MANPVPGSQAPEMMTAARIRAVQLAHAKGFGRGYDPRVVDELIAGCASTIELLTSRLAATRSELIRVRTELDHLQSEAGSDQAVQLLKTAQATADAIITRTMAEQERAAEEARELAEQARVAAVAGQRENERRARQVAEEARHAAVLQEQAGERLHRLTVATELAEQEIEREARQLQTFRDSTKAQIDEFIDGMLDHVAEQYGRAHPLAAQAAAAATTRSPTVAPVNGPKPPAGGRGRRAPRIAGRPSVPTERLGESTSDGVSATTHSTASHVMALPRQTMSAARQHL